MWRVVVVLVRENSENRWHVLVVCFGRWRAKRLSKVGNLHGL